MKLYYISGLPYSENELYHHGVLKQRWGVRNYQNPDGSLTDLGRQHYGVGPAREKKNGIGRRFVTYQVNKIKARHPWMFTDDELDTAMDRAKNEYNYLKTRTDYSTMKRDTSVVRNVAKNTIGKGANAVGDILGSAAKTLSNKAVNQMADKMFGNDPMLSRNITLSEILANPSGYSKKEYDIALALFNGRKAYEEHEWARRKQMSNILGGNNPNPSPPSP